MQPADFEERTASIGGSRSAGNHCEPAMTPPSRGRDSRSKVGANCARSTRANLASGAIVAGFDDPGLEAAFAKTGDRHQAKRPTLRQADIDREMDRDPATRRRRAQRTVDDSWLTKAAASL